MKKVESPHNVLCIVGVSRFIPLKLNREIITLLMALSSTTGGWKIPAAISELHTDELMYVLPPATQLSMTLVSFLSSCFLPAAIGSILLSLPSGSCPFFHTRTNHSPGKSPQSVWLRPPSSSSSLLSLVFAQNFGVHQDNLNVTFLIFFF
jgi:hypothetical protein